MKMKTSARGFDFKKADFPEATNEFKKDNDLAFCRVV